MAVEALQIIPLYSGCSNKFHSPFVTPSPNLALSCPAVVLNLSHLQILLADSWLGALGLVSKPHAACHMLLLFLDVAFSFARFLLIKMLPDFARIRLLPLLFSVILMSRVHPIKWEAQASCVNH